MKDRIFSLAALILTVAVLTAAPVTTAGDSAAVTPPPGSPLRRAILDTLRQQLRDLPATPLVFTVRHLKVAGDWAYLIADPRSQDGTAHYETVEVLLQRQGGAWQPLEFRPSGGECEDDPDCADDRRYYRRLQQRYPKLPASILPSVE